ncbi:Tartrate transporter [Mycena kentingensis (nom. inval.)]|nr:Tartrate transporter [Mycena kentingensis (nom. inval.)]
MSTPPPPPQHGAVFDTVKSDPAPTDSISIDSIPTAGTENRTAMTAARLKGFQQDLGLSDIQYAVVLSILYATYSPAQVPSNMILNRVSRPSVYIGLCVCAWGLASAMTGVVHSANPRDVNSPALDNDGLPRRSTLSALHRLARASKAAFYPGAVYLLTCWYTKKEMALRSAILYAGLLVSNAFGSLLAAGVFEGMQDVRGMPAWRWLFVLEGSVTICAGFFMMWLLPDFPKNTSWMSPAERRLAQLRIANDAGEADNDSKQDSPLQGLLAALREPIVWLFVIMAMALQVGSGSGVFFPTLAKTLGYGTETTLLLAAAPWLVATIFCIANAYHADKTGERYFHMSTWWWLHILGLIIASATMNIGARYFSLFLLACSGCAYALLLPWVANAVPRPPAKRAAAIGIVNSMSNVGVCISTFVWPSSWGPSYRKSMLISLVGVAVACVFALIIRQVMILRNKRLDGQEASALADMDSDRVKDAARLEGITAAEALERRKVVRFLY